MLRWARDQDDVWLQKYHGSVFGLLGHPDVYGNVGKLAVYMELKQPGKPLKPTQAAIGRKISASGARFERVDNFEHFLEIIEELRE